MSLKLAEIVANDPRKKLTRQQILELSPAIEYNDGRTLQCHKDECDIQKIMARFDKTNTISHLAKYQGVYADFSDFDFHEQTNRLTKGREIFDDLPAELRREFNQSPAKFFAYVNDPANSADLREKLPALAKPGRQIKAAVGRPTADLQAALAAASEPVASVTPNPDPQ